MALPAVEDNYSNDNPEGKDKEMSEYGDPCLKKLSDSGSIIATTGVFLSVNSLLPVKFLVRFEQRKHFERQGV